MPIYLSSTALLIAFSICLLIIIVFCNFALIFCKKFPCLIEENEQNINLTRINFSRNVNIRNNELMNSLSIQDLAEIAPAIKYGILINKQRNKINDENNNELISRSSSISNSSTQKSKYCYSCVICLNIICDEELIRCLPCKHIYHSKCIDQWIKIRSICPLCNTNIKLLFNQIKEDRLRNIYSSPHRTQGREEIEYSENHQIIEILSPNNLLITTFNVLMDEK